MNSQLVNTKFGEIEYRSIGKGVPVVFIHGGHSNCNETLGHKGFDLSKYQLITPSRPGYGITPLNGNYTPKDAANLIAALLQYLKIDKAIIYGISAGGLTAIELAANHNDKVQKLILASAISKKWLNKNEKIYITAKFIFNSGIERFIWGMIRFFSAILPGMIANSFYKQFSIYPPHKLRTEDKRDLIFALKYYRSKKGFLNDIDQDIDEVVLTMITCPSLIIHSKYDNSVSFEHARHARNTIQNSRLIELRNEWGHLIWLGKDSEQSVLKISEFIEE